MIRRGGGGDVAMVAGVQHHDVPLR
uniref:Uncharacterized protein n=1 Tax=Arundo donax TaxID=35708 RepID=A0A0A9F5D4_ARUDO